MKTLRYLVFLGLFPFIIQAFLETAQTNPEIISLEESRLWEFSGTIWQGQVVLDLDINLEEHPDPYINAIRGHVRDFFGEYQICVHTGYTNICRKIREIKNTPTLDVLHPILTGGVSRISIWLQHMPPGAASPDRVVNNVTSFQWLNEIEAADELGRRLIACKHNQDTTCEQVVSEHLNIAKSRLPKYVEAREEPKSRARARKNIEVVTTVYNVDRRHPNKFSDEGLWVRPMSEQDSSVKYVVLSATPIPNGTFEDTLPDPTLFTSPNIDVQPFANPGRAQECPGVMSYLVENYNELPDIMIFLHGYPFDHNPWLEEQLLKLFEINRRIGLPEFKFVHANIISHPKCVHSVASNSMSRLLGLDDELFGPNVSMSEDGLEDTSSPAGVPTIQPCYMANFCCGQFLVSRKAVLARPRSFYRLMIFLHGYPFDHNPWLEEQLFELFKINRNYGLPEFRFVHLNLELHPKCVLNRAPNGQSRLLGLDEELFNKSSSKSFGMPRSEICYSAKFCCGQFLVSRKAVLARPRSFYRLALKLAREQGSCNQLEFLWHAIFRKEAVFTGLNLGEFLSHLRPTLNESTLIASWGTENGAQLSEVNPVQVPAYEIGQDPSIPKSQRALELFGLVKELPPIDMKEFLRLVAKPVAEFDTQKKSGKGRTARANAGWPNNPTTRVNEYTGSSCAV
eukprot:CAMPEP_0172649434 /NCGR_PEP_ID=MMETSP1068-20121228/241785_1 /TAXON_ID=35684 /ORGANISM="Pseudopedinella elastica, Strain CCMP716" /LENGTH=680 /DNA_ID=CAMNT_0013463785 /DNA_START=140 /DNA_END=2183 /DNA_ORIENTATION=-